MLRAALLSLVVALVAGALGLALRPEPPGARPTRRVTAAPESGAPPTAAAGMTAASDIVAANGAALAPEPLVDDTPWDGPTLEVRVLHGDTGAPLRSAVTATFGDGEPVAVPRDGLVYRLARTPLRPGEAVDLRLESLRASPGDAPAGAALALRCNVSEETETVRATIVHRPRVTVILAPDGPDGGPPPGRVTETALAMGSWTFRPDDRRGVRFSVPRYVGARLRARVVTTRDEARAYRVLAPRDTRVVIPVAIGRPPPPGGTSGVLCSSAPMGSVARRGTATLEVWVRDIGGRPVRGAAVEVDAETPEGLDVDGRARTDGDGHATISRLPTCAGTVRVRPPRGLPSVADFRVEEGGSATVVATEPQPSPVRVTVTDRHGAPIPCAAVQPRFGHADLDPGPGRIVDINPTTGADGTCVIASAPSRGVRFLVTWGGASVVADPVGPGEHAAALPFPEVE